MADSWNALGSAVYSRLAPYLGSALYDAIAPGTVQPPFGVWQVLVTDDEYKFGSTPVMESIDVQLRFVSDRDWPDKARAMYGTAHTYMQDAPLSVSGYRVLRCRRRGGKFQYMDTGNFWHVGAVYQVDLEAT